MTDRRLVAIKGETVRVIALRRRYEDYVRDASTALESHQLLFEEWEDRDFIGRDALYPVLMESLENLNRAERAVAKASMDLTLAINRQTAVS